MLPGDEIVEKKHANIKMLTAQMGSADLSKRKTRKWPGLGRNDFNINYEQMFEQYKSSQPETAAAEQTALGDEVPNEINSEIEVQNTNHHKSIIKARNEFYNIHKNRFID